MPIEIKELHIKVSVAAAPGGQPSATSSQPSASGGGGSQGKDEIVAECVEQVLQILQQKHER